MSQGGDDYEQALQLLPKIISAKIGEVAPKTESISTGCLCRVPEDLRKLKENAYTPQLIAIGPLHQNDKHLQTPMQEVKKSYANHLLHRLIEGIEDPEVAERTKFTLFQECEAEMKLSIDKAEECYAEDVTLDEQMMLVDGCFILELLYRFYELRHIHEEEDEEEEEHLPHLHLLCHPIYRYHQQDLMQRAYKERERATNRMTRMQRPLRGERDRKISSRTKTSDPIFDSKLTAAIVKNDLLLFENQIPFFVLEKLFRLTVERIPNNHDHKLSLTDYVSLYFGNIIMCPEENSTNSSTARARCGSQSDTVLEIFGNKMRSYGEDEVLNSNGSYYHILHKLHQDYRPNNPDDQIEMNELLELMPSATELNYAGVKFVPGAGKDLFKVKFTEPEGPFWWCHGAHFEIPTLGIHDPTELFLRNLIAFEQCCPGVSQHFTSYAFLMDMLVNSARDVKLLDKARVVSNYLGGTEDTMDLFDNLCKEVILGEFFFADTCNRAIEYSERFWQKNLRGVKRTYFDHPWMFIAFCLGVIPFGMTVVSLVKSFL